MSIATQLNSTQLIFGSLFFVVSTIVLIISVRVRIRFLCVLHETYAVMRCLSMLAATFVHCVETAIVAMECE